MSFWSSSTLAPSLASILSAGAPLAMMGQLRFILLNSLTVFRRGWCVCVCVCVVLCWPRFISPIFNVASPKLIFSSSSIVIKELAGSFPQDFVFFFPFFLINRTLSLEIKKTLSVCADVLPPLYTRLASLPSIRYLLYLRKPKTPTRTFSHLERCCRWLIIPVISSALEADGICRYF